MRVGVIGVGRIGSFHAGVLAGHPDVTQVLVTDADLDRAEAVARDVCGVTARPRSRPSSAPWMRS